MQSHGQFISKCFIKRWKWKLRKRAADHLLGRSHWRAHPTGHNQESQVLIAFHCGVIFGELLNHYLHLFLSESQGGCWGHAKAKLDYSGKKQKTSSTLRIRFLVLLQRKGEQWLPLQTVGVKLGVSRAVRKHLAQSATQSLWSPECIQRCLLKASTLSTSITVVRPTTQPAAWDAPISSRLRGLFPYPVWLSCSTHGIIILVCFCSHFPYNQHHI